MKKMIFKFGKILGTLSVLSLFSACESPSQTDLATLTGNTTSATPTPSVSAGAPASIAIFGGNSQNGTVSSVLSNPLSARVTDAQGIPVPNISVTFSVTSGGGSINSAATVVTDVTGIASTSVRLGPTVGTQTFTASMPTGTITSTLFSMNALAIPSYLKVVALAGTTSIPDTGYYVGDTAQYRAILVDGTGSFITEIAANWAIGGTLAPANLTVTGGNPSKYANYSPTSVGSGTIQVVVNDSTLITNNNIVSTTASTGTLTVTQPLIPDTMSLISGNNQSGTVGTNLGQNLVVKVVNVSNVAVPGVNVTFSVQNGGGQIVTAQPVVTDANGFASCVVKLGGTVGNTNTFLATMPAGTSRQVSFSATGSAGAAYTVGFVQQPSGGNTGAAFSNQPTVEIRDSYGNRITSDSSSTVTLSITPTFGQGTLTGTLTATMSSGLATFTNAGYTFGGTDNTSTNVKLTATSNVGGVLTAISNGTTIGQIIAAAQCNAAAGWQTVDGGCKDLTSGLVWSATSGSTMTWHQAVWDSTTSGSTAPEAWEVARGITTDAYDTSGYFIQSNGYDSSAASYCHDLTESGYSDWRMPTYNEAAQANTDGAAALKNVGAYMWVGTRSGAAAAYVWENGSVTNGGGFGNGYLVKCVRNPPPTQLLVAQQVGASTYGLGTNVAFPQQPIIRVADSTNSTTSYASNNVTLTVTGGAGQLCTTITTTGVTSGCSNSKTVAAVNGLATFTNLSYSGADTVTLTATSPGLAPVTLSNFSVSATYPKANCLSVGGVWINGAGGCKDTTTGIIYNHSSYNGYSMGAFYMNWFDYIWDQTTVGGNASTQDANDDGRTNDYDFSPTYAAYNQIQGASPDNSPVNYCHSLQESGKSDWLPMPYEYGLANLADQGKSPVTYLENGAINSNYHWTSLVVGGSTTSAYVQYTGNATSQAKTYSSYPVMCVRRDPPAALGFSVQPGGGANGFGSGVIWASQPTVKVVDADGAGPLFYDNTVITLSVVAATDTTGGTGKLFLYNNVNKIVPEGTTYNGMTVAVGGKSVTLQATNGVAAFTGLAYSKKGGEKFRLRASATATWHGQSIPLTPVTTADFILPAIYSIDQCNAQAGWTTEYGGCHDTQVTGGTGVVWSHVITSGTWYDAIWDSTVVGADAADADDGANTNDYDAAYPPGAGVDNSVLDVCHRLNLNGYTDWHLPTYAEMNIGYSNSTHNGFTALNSAGNTGYIWSSATVQATPANAYMMTSATGVWYGSYPKSIPNYSFRCVRPATP